MFEWLKALVSRRASGGERDFDPPWTRFDPDSGVRVPRPHAPTSRTGSVAVEEPDEDEECLVALGSLHSRKI
jgi:hypothetical protein